MVMGAHGVSTHEGGDKQSVTQTQDSEQQNVEVESIHSLQFVSLLTQNQAETLAHTFHCSFLL